ncbi:hypothetical protein [Persephonella sp.]
MGNFITKIWFYTLIAVLLISALFFSVFVFFVALVLILITVPYIFYIRWKAKKELEQFDVRDKLRKL